MFDIFEVKYQNVRGFRIKINQVYLNVLQCVSDIVILTESWLNNSINNSELLGSTYTCYRNDRQEKSRGGRVLIAVKKRWIVKPSNTHSALEYLLVKIYNNNTTFYIFSVYIPPKSSHDIYKLLF